MKLWKWPGPAGKNRSLEEVLIGEFELLHGPTSAQKLVDLYPDIHSLVGKGQGRSALCLSGGGIRSASFGLGVLRALARRKLLLEFDYLSTVSGGGYIGGWLSAWRKLAGDKAVMEGLTTNKPDRYVEPAEITWLRANSNYLTPKLGAMSADTWTLAALYIRNLFLNWLIFLPAILTVLLFPILAHDVMETAPHWPPWAHCATAAVALVLLLAALATSVAGRFEGALSRVTQGRFLRRVLLPIYLAATLLSFSAVSNASGDIGPGRGAAAGAAVYAVAWLWAFVDRWWSNKEAPGHTKRTLGDWFWRAMNLLGWAVAGAIAGGLIGLGYDLAHDNLAKVGSALIVVLGVGWVAMSFFLAESIYLGLASYSSDGDVDREWLARSSGWFVVATLGWAVLAALVLYAGAIIGMVWGGWKTLAIGGAGAGIAGSWIGSSAKTLAVELGKRVESFSMTRIISLATVIFVAALAVLLSDRLPGALDWLELQVGWTSGWRPVLTFAVMVVFTALAIGFALFVNINRFSSHSIYRNRLARAFLGGARGTSRNVSPTADLFTDFDPDDNVRVRELVTPPGSAVVDPERRPRLFPVINMALNVVGGGNLAWQERKAEPFVVTPHASGNHNVGFWPTEHYGSSTGGISLATAMAISGAAASPNQGYHSSPLVGLLMTLLNVRLGWWLGNPLRADAAELEGPRLGIVQLVYELFGLTTSSTKYIYLSDGGHFENLGIYEMVRRRCHLIVACDAGCDPDYAFADLGNAVRKAYIDLGVRIEFQKIDMKKRDVTPPGLYCAIATIHYPETETPGHLLYLKPGFPSDGTQPADVTAYARANPAFPHETTADQFFSESQMESYRSLGSHIIDVVFGPENAPPGPPAPIPAMRPFWQHIQDYVTPKKPTPRRRAPASSPRPLRFPLPRV